MYVYVRGRRAVAQLRQPTQKRKKTHCRMPWSPENCVFNERCSGWLAARVCVCVSQKLHKYAHLLSGLNLDAFRRRRSTAQTMCLTFCIHILHDGDWRRRQQRRRRHRMNDGQVHMRVWATTWSRARARTTILGDMNLLVRIESN